MTYQTTEERRVTGGHIALIVALLLALFMLASYLFATPGSQMTLAGRPMSGVTAQLGAW